MESGKFGYQWQKLAEARRFLMAFYVKEAARFANAATCCQLALRDFDSDTVRDKAARAKVEALKSLMEVAAGTMTYDQKIVFGTTVDEVADWFAKEYWLSKGSEPTKPTDRSTRGKAPRRTSVARPKATRAPKKPKAKPITKRKR